MGPDWKRFLESLNSSGFSPAILFVALVMIWNGKTVDAYTRTMTDMIGGYTQDMMSQVQQIQKNQREEIRIYQKYKDKTDRKLNKLDVRVLTLEQTNDMLGFPLYYDNEEKRTYLQRE